MTFSLNNILKAGRRLLCVKTQTPIGSQASVPTIRRKDKLLPESLFLKGHEKTQKRLMLERYLLGPTTLLDQDVYLKANGNRGLYLGKRRDEPRDMLAKLGICLHQSTITVASGKHVQNNWMTDDVISKIELFKAGLKPCVL